MAGVDVGVRFGRLELGHDGVKHSRRGLSVGVDLEHQDLEAEFIGPQQDSVLDGNGEGVVFVSNHKRLGAGICERLHRRTGVVAGGREDAEDILVAAIEDGFCSAIGFDHDDLILLGDRAGRHRQAAAVGTEDEVDFILRNQLLGQTDGSIGVALIVVIDDLYIVEFPADVDPAQLIVDIVRPKIVALANVQTYCGVTAGLRERRADSDRPCDLGHRLGLNRLHVFFVFPLVLMFDMLWLGLDWLLGWRRCATTSGEGQTGNDQGSDQQPPFLRRMHCLSSPGL